MNWSRLPSVGAVLVSAAILAAANTAPASAHYSQCPANELCVWEHTGYEGRFAYTSEPSPNVGADMNDRISSYWNRTNQWFSLYEHENYDGWCIAVGPDSSRIALPNGHWDADNDEVTSLKPGICQRPMKVYE
ncbi:peptidase inhibitor family I36 protein [Streptomyces sp. NPDC085946]|uniref:peptidase inhibitor family I36 protein n=1 Tax=Streptomyces sp. NPDC085946 TaxID=3365744 RepID=UPI0037CDC568